MRLGPDHVFPWNQAQSHNQSQNSLGDELHDLGI